MTKDELAKIEFYKSGAILIALNQHKFNSKEKNTINDAIISAKKDNPDMKLLDKADQLWRRNKTSITNRTKNIKPISTKIVQSSGDQYKEKNPLSIPRESNSFSRWSYEIFFSTIITVILYFVMDGYGKYDFEEAVEECSKLGKVLPLTLHDFESSGYTFGQLEEYWTADGKLMTMPFVGILLPPEKGEGYSYICIDKKIN